MNYSSLQLILLGNPHYVRQKFKSSFVIKIFVKFLNYEYGINLFKILLVLRYVFANIWIKFCSLQKECLWDVEYAFFVLKQCIISRILIFIIQFLMNVVVTDYPTDAFQGIPIPQG